MNNTEQALLTALKLARKHMNNDTVDVHGDNSVFETAKSLIDEAIESGEAVRRQAIRDHRKEESESDNI